MLEIICLIWLWRVNGKHAIERGQNPKKYRALTLGLWFGLEFTGTFVGAWLMQLLNAGDNAFYGAYFFGIIGAAIPLTGLYFGYNAAISYILTKFNVLTGVVDFIPVWQIYQTLLPISLGLGIGIGLIGSFFTTRKHLRV